MVKPKSGAKTNQTAQKQTQKPSQSSLNSNYQPTRAFNVLRQRLEANQQEMRVSSQKLGRPVQPTEEQLEALLLSLEPFVLELQKEQLDSPLFSADLPLLQLTKSQLLSKLGLSTTTSSTDSKTSAAITPPESTTTSTTPEAGYNQFTPEAFTAFKTWLKELATKDNIPDTGFDTKVDLAANLKEGTGIIALKDIPANELVIKIPQSAMLTPLHLAQDPYYKQLLTLFPSFNLLSPNAPRGQDSLLLPLAIIYERLRGKDSPYYPYFNLLPSYVSNIPFASLNDIISTLKGSQHYFTALRIYYNVIQQYVFLISTIALSNDRSTQKPQPKQQQGQPPQAGFIRPFSILIYRWAVSIAMSRQNPVPLILDPTKAPTQQVMALIPGFDFGNHFIPQDASLCRINTHFNLADFTSETESLVDVKKGDQFYIYYGQRPTSHYALYQGFVPADNSFSPAQTKTGTSERVGLTSTTAAVVSPTEDDLQQIRSNIRKRLGLEGFIFTLPLQLQAPSAFNQEVEDQVLAEQQISLSQQHPTWARIWRAFYLETLDKEECGRVLKQLGPKPSKETETEQQYQLVYNPEVAIIANTSGNMLRAVNHIIKTIDELRLLQLTSVEKVVASTNFATSSSEVRPVLQNLFNIDITNYQNQISLLKSFAKTLE